MGLHSPRVHAIINLSLTETAMAYWEPAYSLQDIESSLRSIADPDDGSIPYVVARYTALIAFVGGSFDREFSETDTINACDFTIWLRTKVV